MYLDAAGEPIKADSGREDLNNSFTEYTILTSSILANPIDLTGTKRAKIKKSIYGDTKVNQYSAFSAHIMKKMSPYQLKVTEHNVFPIKVFKSKFLVDALDSVEIPKKNRKCLKKLFREEEFRKAFLYLFWIFIALKFQARTFGNLDHYNS